MGSGSWTTASFVNYATTRGYDTDSRGVVTTDYSNQEMFKSKELDSSLNPKNVVRECCDSKEHPNTVPVILALDVTGSMGQAAVEISKKLNNIMTKLYEQVEDIEFMVMGIGDLSYDRFPIFELQNSLRKFILSLVVVVILMNLTLLHGILVPDIQSLIVGIEVKKE